MDAYLEQLERFAAGESSVAEELADNVDQWRSASDEDVAKLAEMLPELIAGGDLDRITPLLVRTAENLSIRARSTTTSPGASTIEGLAAAYRKLPQNNDLRPHILRVLATSADADSLKQVTELLVEDPPAKPEQTTLAMVPLVQNKQLNAELLYPKLMDAVAHRSAATAVLDVTNFLVRNNRLTSHPAADRAARLATLLEGVTSELEKLEQPPADSNEDRTEQARTVSESVELAVSLCDTLALAGDKSIVGKLYPLLELRHRRLQAEAASALARLGEDAGLDHLAGLAEHSVVRTRALAYLDELGAMDRADEAYRTAESRAEGDLVCWLAEPQQFGFPPQTVTLVESRELHWPGFDDMVECFLFQYVYPTPQGDLIGIGLSGPGVHSFAADLHELSPDDLFGAFAGWATEHEDCGVVPAEALDGPRDTRMQQAAAELVSLGYSGVEPVQMGLFFGKEYPVLTADRNGESGAAVVDSEAEGDARIAWFPTGSTARPIPPELVYQIYIGKILLQSFNPE